MTTSQTLGRRHLFSALLFAAATLGCSDPLSPDEAHVEALAETQRWVSANPTSWTVRVEGAAPPRRTSWSQPCTMNPPSGLVALSVEARRTRLTAYFSCAKGAPQGVPAMREALEFVVLDELPHGIRVPNWSFEVLTPTTSVSTGIDIREGSSGRMLFAVNTNLFAVYGHSDRESCRALADGPSPPTCYVQREHRIPLALEIQVPMDAAMFR